MRCIRPGLLVVLLWLMGIPASSEDSLASADPTQWQALFDQHGVSGSFILHDLSTSRTLRLNPDRCDTRFIPASTFKLPHTMIGLETGEIPDEHFSIAWDGSPQWQPSWERDHNLATAFRFSVFWFYQQVARQIGRQRMAQWLEHLDYGNQSLEGPIDRFWLDGPLAISPNEQLYFLRRFLLGHLPISQRTMRITRQVALMEEGGDWQLFGKTGWTQAGERHGGWIIGWCERQGRTVLFVLQAEAPLENRNFGRARLQIAESILNELGLMDGKITYGKPGDA